ncbi:MAG TPA: D-alanine--D-alanine ligase family protein [Candidatus Saccharimonadales bacterium]|nr:D-alanine--D-alanine ligase family protein [Candidatus Saccharimonadales bacterium]
MKSIAVIFGGQSTEHDVSIVTALASIIKPLELTKQYKVEAVYIARDGSWYWGEKLKDVKLYQSGEIEDYMRRAPKVHLLFDNGLTLVKSSQFAGRKMYRKIDVVFPAMHGTHGEDGELMGLLEMANVPYVGCGVAASSVAMDKVLAKQVTGSSDIPSTPWVWFYANELAQPKKVLDSIKGLKYPLFVKPAHLGSSIGISRVEKESELINALEVAAHYDDKVIVEQEVSNLIEVTLPIIGNEDPTPAKLERPLTRPEDFFDFDTKYLRGGKKSKSGAKAGTQGYSEIPAKLPKELYAKAEDTALNVYKALGCSGIARVDLLIDSKSGSVYFNEVNPLPGGLYAHNWRLAGISSVDLVNRLVQYAEQRWQQRQKLTTSFNTSYLKQF